jgi:hypothetical protein
MGASAAAAVAVTFVWLGMVLAISFLEAPLKFRAHGVTIPIGLGIGRLVFRALNLVEAAFAAAVVAAVIAGGLPAAAAACRPRRRYASPSPPRCSPSRSA